eukprot:2128414-Lingulodinium_polyedra.AAC.1
MWPCRLRRSPRRVPCASLRGFAFIAVHAHRPRRAERQCCGVETLRRPLGRSSRSIVLPRCRLLRRACCGRRVPNGAAMGAVPSIVPPAMWA